MSNIAWAAGLFDGEGTIFASSHAQRKRRQVRLHAAVSMTDEETVRRFHSAVEVGYVLGPYQPKPNHYKPKWVWHGGTDDHIRTAMQALWPWLSSAKKSQAEQAFAARDEFLANLVPKTDFRLSACLHGHDLNLHRYVAPDGRPYCRVCRSDRSRRYRAAKANDAGMFAEISA